jgi:DNA-binding HxlR family transcriptional regulator
VQELVSSCPIEDAMRVLSGRWATLLLYYLQDRPKRFSELQRDNPTISHRILTLELRKLADAGLIERTAHAGFPLRVDYRLSASGAELMPMIDAIGDWWEASHPRRRHGGAAA